MKPIAVSILIGLLVSPICQAGPSIFLKLDGIPGESTDDLHADEIEILSISHNMANAGTVRTGGGSGASKAILYDIRLVKFADRATPRLVKHVATGQHIPEAKITVMRTGESALEFYVINLESVLVTSLASSASVESGRVTETISLNFGKIEIIYTPTKEDGSGDATVEFCFDVAVNVEC